MLHYTLLVCTFALGLGSELIQGLLPNGRSFDPWDVLANIVGSLAALGLASAYHRRSAERRRRAKYSALNRDGMEGAEDLELGEGGIRTGLSSQEAGDGQRSGVVPVVPRTVEEELVENAEDDAWDEDDITGTSTAGTKITPASSSVGDDDASRNVAMD